MALTKEMQEAVDELKGTHEIFKKEIVKMNDDGLDPLKKTNVKVEALQKALDEKQAALDALIVKFNAIPAPTSEVAVMKRRAKKALRNAYLKHIMLHGDQKASNTEANVQFFANLKDHEKAYMTKGFSPYLADRTKNEIDKKAMALGVDILGGYLAPAQFVNQIIESVIVISPIRDYASNFNTTQAAVELPIRTQRAGVTKKVENITNNENQNIQFGLTKITTKMYISIQVIPVELLQDAAFDLEQLLDNNLSIEFASSQGTDFILGDGRNAPEGILTNSNITVQQTATASTFVASDIFTMQYALKESYAMAGTWMANRTTIGYIRKMVSSTGQFLWQPGLDGGQAAFLSGRPIREAPDMTAVTPTSGQKILLFGDFKRGYGIVDRIGMMMLRDPYSVSSATQVKYVFTMRTGGAVLDTQALGVLKVQ